MDYNIIKAKEISENYKCYTFCEDIIPKIYHCKKIEFITYDEDGVTGDVITVNYAIRTKICNAFHELKSEFYDSLK